MKSSSKSKPDPSSHKHLSMQMKPTLMSQSKQTINVFRLQRTLTKNALDKYKNYDKALYEPFENSHKKFQNCPDNKDPRRALKSELFQSPVVLTNQRKS